MAQINYRTVDVDAYDPEASANFDLSTLRPTVVPASSSDVQTLVGQVRQLLRGGDSEGALRGVLENAPYGADDKAKETYAGAVVEILQSIRQSEMSPLLSRIYQSDGGVELIDVLMKYLYKGMAQSSQPSASASSKQITPQATGFSQISSRGGGEGGGQAMSVLLSWHEKLVEVAGPGSIVRVMTDRRTV
ncbi:MAG: hypothetical protein M1831_000165 [Alyxoria varia]|nr:MAG: hypothetical protein M1831_000165 [Alyxoria varia]